MRKNTYIALAVLAAFGLSQVARAGEGCVTSKSACGAKTPEPSADSKSDHSYGKIDTDALKKLVDAGTPVVLVDARSAKWDDGKRIPGAISVTADSPQDQINSSLPNKDALIVTYCSNLKCPASAKLADKLVELGYKNVIKYPEGLAGWVEAGHSVTEVEKAN